MATTIAEEQRAVAVADVQQQQQQQQSFARRTVSTSDELAQEAGMSALKSGNGVCLTVLGISAGLAARKCSQSLFRYCDPSDDSLRRLCGYACAYTLGIAGRANQLSGVTSASSVFDCSDSKVPAITLSQYIDRFLQYTQASKEVLVAAVAYIDRFTQVNPDGVRLAASNVHRLIATAFAVSSKFNCDQYNSNRYYARVAGVSLAELNAMERAFLRGMDYRFALAPEQYAAYAQPIEFLAAVVELYGDLVEFLADLVGYLRAQWLVQQRQQELLQRQHARHYHRRSLSLIA